MSYRGGGVVIQRNGCQVNADYETPLRPGDVIEVLERYF
jgi:hypothetical protein